MLCGFLPWLGVSPFPVSLPSSFFVSPYLVPSGSVPPLLVPTFSFGLFFVSLVRPHVLLVSTLPLPFAYLFLVPLSLFLFLSLSLCLVFLIILYWGFPQVSPPSLLRVGLFYRFSPFCRAAVSSSPVSLPLSFRVRSFCGCGVLPVVFLFCLFWRFGFLVAYFSCFFPLSFSLRVSSFSCPLFLEPLYFSFPSGSSISLSRVSFCVLLWLRVLSSH